MDAQSARASRLDLSDAELEQLFAKAASLAMQEMAGMRSAPVFDAPLEGATVRAAVAADAPLPREPVDREALFELVESAFATGRRSGPTFFGYVLSPPSAPAVAADLLASVADQNLTSWRSAPSATAIEHQTLNWLSEFVGFGAKPGGLFVSGGSMANLTAVLLAIRTHSEADADRRTLCVYSSTEVHFSVDKAVAALGVRGRSVSTDGALRLGVNDLEAAIARDRERGLVPICVVASAGTTATGAVDPLPRIAELTRREQLWFHIDGAYGAPAAATAYAPAEFDAFAQADSLAVDAHKWLYAPVDCGALLVRDPADGVFGPGSDYVRVLSDAAEESFAFWEHGLELSRRSRALKLWLAFRYYGADRLAQAVAEDIELVALMAELVREAPDLELLCEPSLSVCCFRHHPEGWPEDALQDHNERLLRELQREGRVYPSNVLVHGRFGLRACITNFRTTAADVTRAVELIREVGAALARGGSAEGDALERSGQVP